MENTQEAKVYKDGELMALAQGVRKVSVDLDVDDQGTVTFTCFHLPNVQLQRHAVFQVLHRKPLKDVVSGGGIELGEEQVEPIYLVHGTVETHRGEPSVTAVVLAHPSRAVKGRDLASNLPELYKRFLALI